MSKKILVSTGEPSGEFHGKNLIREIINLSPDHEIFFVGSQDLGVPNTQLVYKWETKRAVTGTITLSDTWEHLKRLRSLLDFIKKNEIKNLVLVDYPGFHLLLLNFLEKEKVKVFYFIPPQVWAWGEWRASLILRHDPILFVIFPWEFNLYKKLGYREIFYVGNPWAYLYREKFKKLWNPADNIISFLPGSRPSQIKRNMRIYKTIKDKLRLLGYEKFYLSLPNEEKLGSFDDFEIKKAPIHEWVWNSNFVVSNIGTINLELAFMGVPFVVVLSVEQLTYFLAKRLSKVKWGSLVNITFGKEVVKEFIGSSLNIAEIVNYIDNMLRSNFSLNELSLNLLKIWDFYEVKNTYKITALKILEFI